MTSQIPTSDTVVFMPTPSTKDTISLNSTYIKGLLFGVKFQHRIEVKPKFGGEIISFNAKRRAVMEQVSVSSSYSNNTSIAQFQHTCPYGDVGNTLYVKESWTYTHATKKGIKGILLSYVADKSEIFIPESEYPENWTPPPPKKGMVQAIAPATLPTKFCRFTATIRSIRAERIKDISALDAQQEGVACKRINNIMLYQDYKVPAARNDFERYTLLCPKQSYLSLCKKIKGAKFINRNPFVWVVFFDFVEIINGKKRQK